MEATRTELAVLGLLAWSGEASGYELHTRVGRSVGFIWAPARSQLYAVLKRLAAAGQVEGRDVVQADRPDKRLFRLTEAGMATLRGVARHGRADRARGPRRHPAQAVLRRVRGPRRDRRQLLDYRERVQRRLGDLSRDRGHIRPEPDMPRRTRLQSLRLGIALMGASLDWADETVAALATAAHR